MISELSRLLSEKRAQTGLEYLLIIGGAVVVVAVVGFILKGAAQNAGNQVSNQVPTTG